MPFRFDIHLSEDDYLAFLCFHLTETAYGKNLMRQRRILVTVLMAALALCINLMLEPSLFSLQLTVFVGIFTVFYTVLFKHILRLQLERQVKQMKKNGKLPFEPAATIDFGEDVIVRSNASGRSEHRYDLLEQICVVKDRYIFIYNSSTTAYCLPLPQIEAQADREEFLNFLAQKCSTVKYFG